MHPNTKELAAGRIYTKAVHVTREPQLCYAQVEVTFYPTQSRRASSGKELQKADDPPRQL